MSKLTLICCSDINETKALVEKGYCPLECSFGGESVVDDLQMDHHGKMSHLESVAIRAYRDYYGKRADNPFFVITHIDADCIFAAAALAGMLPHPNSKSAFKEDLTPLAETIAALDTNPVGLDVLSMPYGNYLVAFNSLFCSGKGNDMLAFAAVYGLRSLLTNPSAQKYVLNAQKSEEENQRQAMEDLKERSQKIKNVLVVQKTCLFGFPQWYQRQEDKANADEIEGWQNPVVASLNTDRDSLSFGCPNIQVAEKLFGKGGLKNVFQKMNEKYQCPPEDGFGGRETIGGSPRGKKMKYEDLLVCADVINDYLEQTQSNQKVQSAGLSDAQLSAICVRENERG
jgi:hypothetical protein